MKHKDLKQKLQNLANALDHGSYVTEESMIAFYLRHFHEEWEDAKKDLLKSMPNHYTDRQLKEVEMFFNKDN